MRAVLPWLQQTGHAVAWSAVLVLVLALSVGAFALGWEIGVRVKAHEEAR